jgi:hypothetical protein
VKEAFGSKFDRSAAEFCLDCVLAKMHRSRPLERVHFDVSPSNPTTGIGGNTGYLLIVDEFTGHPFVYILRSKSEVGQKLQAFQRWADRHFQQRLGGFVVPHTLFCVRSDNAWRRGSRMSLLSFTASGRTGRQNDISGTARLLAILAPRLYIR